MYPDVGCQSVTQAFSLSAADASGDPPPLRVPCPPVFGWQAVPPTRGAGWGSRSWQLSFVCCGLGADFPSLPTAVFTTHAQILSHTLLCLPRLLYPSSLLHHHQPPLPFSSAITSRELEAPPPFFTDRPPKRNPESPLVAVPSCRRRAPREKRNILISGTRPPYCCDAPEFLGCPHRPASALSRAREKKARSRLTTFVRLETLLSAAPFSFFS